MLSVGWQFSKKAIYPYEKNTFTDKRYVYFQFLCYAIGQISKLYYSLHLKHKIIEWLENHRTDQIFDDLDTRSKVYE